MNRANQQQIVQQANMSLIDIRFYELQYFTNFFSVFGLQAVYMAGFTITSLSQQNPGNDSDSNAPYGSIVFYWLTCAICLALGFYTICGALFIQVYGENLAINGPIGSMITSLEGMIIEQRHIVHSFLWTTFFFGLQYIGMCWFRMDQVSAIGVSVVIGMANYAAYNISVRVYNRFSYQNADLKWGEDDGRQSMDTRDMRPSTVEDIGGWVNGTFLPDTSTGGSVAETTSTSTPKSLQEFAKAYGKEQVQGLGGYLTVMVKNRIGQNKWRRRFLVLNEHYLFFYRSKQNFTVDPNSHLNSRPLNLQGYTMVAGSAQPPYAITLVPIDNDDGRKVWRFRCDTSTEYNRWIEVLMVVISVSNEHDVKDFVTIYPDENASVKDDETVQDPRDSYFTQDSRDSRNSRDSRSSNYFKGGPIRPSTTVRMTLHTIRDEDNENASEL